MVYGETHLFKNLHRQCIWI